MSLIPEGIEKALELACAEGIFTEKLAQKVGRLTATDISQRAVDRALERCHDHRNVELRVLDFVRQDLPPKQDLIICSEVLYYMKDEEMLAAVCRKMAAALKPNGYLITAHAHIRQDEPARTGFDWGNPFGVGTIKQVLAAQPGLALEDTIETELYAIHRFRKGPVANPVLRIEDHGTPLDADVAKHIIWGRPALSVRRHGRRKSRPRFPSSCITGSQTKDPRHSGASARRLKSSASRCSSFGARVITQ